MSEKGLKKKEDDASSTYGGVIGNGTVLAWHGTLEKLTLPHDANSVVQNKKGNQTKNQRRKPTRTIGEYTLADCTAVFSCCLCSRGGVFLRLSLEYSCFRID